MTTLLKDRRGTALVEFALVLPVLTVLLFGILSYGQYFLLAHTAQQVANDAARATVAGLTSAERAALARASVALELAALPEIDAGRVTTEVAEAPRLVTVRIRLDATYLPIFRTAILPMPDALIERRAVVRPGGFE